MSDNQTLSESQTVLCYEVWSATALGRELVASYWDVMRAWVEMRTLDVLEPNSDHEVIVANGTEVDVRTGVRTRRSDVQ
jgi:hypothetical protein